MRRKKGDIYYHQIAGPQRPFVIREVLEVGCHLRNLDDGANIFLTHETMDYFELEIK